MSQAKQTSKRRSRAKAITLGVAGALSFAGGPSEAAVGPVGDTPTENTAPVITLGDEEISDVSLATFYVFDNENAGTHRPGLQLAKKRSHTEAAEAARLTEAVEAAEAVEAVEAAEARQAAEGRMVCSR
jgi:hypothetical protein